EGLRRDFTGCSKSDSPNRIGRAASAQLRERYKRRVNGPLLTAGQLSPSRWATRVLCCRRRSGLPRLFFAGAQQEPIVCKAMSTTSAYALATIAKMWE